MATHATTKDILVHPQGTLAWQGRHMRCALGEGGVSREKREGDGATPAGSFPLRRVYYRADRLERPSTALPVEALSPLDGWCDDPADPRYNHKVQQPYPASLEPLWRDDHTYDVLVVLGYNDAPVLPGCGSAIFLHIARPDYRPTRGCVAVSRKDLLRILEECEPATRLCVLAEGGT